MGEYAFNTYMIRIKTCIKPINQEGRQTNQFFNAKELSSTIQRENVKCIATSYHVKMC